MMFDDCVARPLPQYQAIKHGTTVKEFFEQHMVSNRRIVISDSGKVLHDGRLDDIEETVLNMPVFLAFPTQKKYAYCGEYDGYDADIIVYHIVVKNEVKE